MAKKKSITRAEVVDYLDRTLRTAEIPDRSCNGLQVEGTGEVIRVGLAVDACLASYQAAVRANCQLLVVHHGLIWEGIKKVTGHHHRHLRFLMEHNLNLYASHLPLDLHPEVGNNACLARMLKLREKEFFGDYHGIRVGLQGVLPALLDRKVLAGNLEKKLGGKALILAAGRQRVKTVGIVSGNSGGNILHEAVERRLDCFLTGEANYAHYQPALEAGINIIYMHHYYSEKAGVLALGERLHKTFSLETVFLDVPPPLPV